VASFRKSIFFKSDSFILTAINKSIFFFWGRISLYTPGWSRTHSVAQATSVSLVLVNSLHHHIIFCALLLSKNILHLHCIFTVYKVLSEVSWTLSSVLGRGCSSYLLQGRTGLREVSCAPGSNWDLEVDGWGEPRPPTAFSTLQNHPK
jgi:hypothetical protein